MYSKKISILLIEDNTADSRLVSESLAEVGNYFSYRLEYSADLSDGLAKISKEELDIILLDLNLPDSNGLDTLTSITKRCNDLPVVILAGLEESDLAEKTLKEGAQDYLIKGQFDGNSLLRSIRYAIARKSNETEKTQYAEKLEKVAKEWRSTFDAMEDAISVIDLEGRILRANKAMSTLVDKSFEEIIGNICKYMLDSFSHSTDKCPILLAKVTKKREMRIVKAHDKFFSCTIDPMLDENKNIFGMVHILSDITAQKKTDEEIKENLNKIKITFEQTISAFSQLVEIKDPYTSGHQKRVSQIAVAVAMDLGLSKESIEAVRLSSLVHDIGKISIPASILSKPGKISLLERAIIETHVILGYDIVKEIDFPYPIAAIVFQHHERMNGSGYPNGLKDKEIMLEAKIISVADTLEAMSSHRPYREARTIKETVDEIVNNKNILYDGDVVDSCLRLLKKGKILKLSK